MLADSDRKESFDAPRWEDLHYFLCGTETRDSLAQPRRLGCSILDTYYVVNAEVPALASVPPLPDAPPLPALVPPVPGEPPRGPYFEPPAATNPPVLDEPPGGRVPPVPYATPPEAVSALWPPVGWPVSMPPLGKPPPPTFDDPPLVPPVALDVPPVVTAPPSLFPVSTRNGRAARDEWTINCALRGTAACRATSGGHLTTARNTGIDGPISARRAVLVTVFLPTASHDQRRAHDRVPLRLSHFSPNPSAPKNDELVKEIVHSLGAAGHYPPPSLAKMYKQRCGSDCVVSYK